jgi:hypothetical protein
MIFCIDLALLGHHMQQVDPRSPEPWKVPKHSHHFFDMTFAGISNQKILEHDEELGLHQPMADSPDRADGD